MKGSVCLRSEVKTPYWYVSWPVGRKRYKIAYYLGESEPMFQTHPNENRDIGHQKAQKLLAMMQSDEERKCFRIEKYTGGKLTDVIPYLEQWLESRSKTLTPGGFIKYRTAVKNYLIPFFEEKSASVRPCLVKRTARGTYGAHGKQMANTREGKGGEHE
jgi:hypothetical protein